MMPSDNSVAQKILLALLLVSVLFASGCATRTNNKLHNALIDASEPDTSAAEQALKEGADPNSLRHNGARPLHAAFGGVLNLASDFNQDLFDLLVSYGADVSLSVTQSDDLPPLFIASSYQGVKAVLEAGADINQQNAKGETVLHYSLSKSPAAVKLLLDEGADPAIENNEGLSAIEVSKIQLKTSHKHLQGWLDGKYIDAAKMMRNRAIRGERVLALLEGRDVDEELIARKYPPVEDNRLEIASQKVINNNSGEYLSPYTSDGVTAEWVNQAINAGIGAQVGTAAGAAAAGVTAQQLSDNFAAVALVSMAGSAIGEAIGRKAAIEASGGWDHIRETSDMSFSSLNEMARYLRLKHGNDENFKEVLAATRQVYPDLAN